MKGGRLAVAIRSRTTKAMQRKFSKGLHKLRACRRQVEKQVESECSDGDLPFVAVKCNGRKRRVVSGPARMARMRSNKSYKPGD